jgi:LacI family transcriptional regulator
VDVARLAGVSTGTVSRVLSRPEMISEATRARVMAAVERLGYVTNGSARALAVRRTGTVGALVPRFGTSSFPTMIQALESTLAAGGYTLLLSAPEHARAKDSSLLRTLLERGVDAVALLGSEHAPQTFSLLSAYRVPYVLMWGDERAELQTDQGPGGACVGFDEAAAAALVVDHLADLGHRRIAFIGGRRDDNERARRRFQGLLAAVAARGLTLAPAATIDTEYGFGQGFDAMQTLLARGLPFSAVICGNDYLAAGVLAALDAAGIAVPGRISVASFNDNEFAGYLHPPLTTVHVPIADMGAEAGRYLLARLRGEPAQAPSRLPVRLAQRSSTGPAPVDA